MAHVDKEPVRTCSVCTPRNGGMFHYVLKWSERSNGKRKFRRETFHTRKEALARKTEVEAEHQRVGTVRDARVAEVAFGTVAQAWLDSLAPRVANGKLKQRTLDDYAAVLRRYVLPVWEGVPVGAISGQRAEAWAGELAAQGFSAGTYRHAWSAFNRVLKYALRHNILTANPADKVETDNSVDVEPFEGKALTAEEVASVVELVVERYPVYGVMVQLLAYTGVRAAELAGLEIADLTLNETDGVWTGSVRVQRTRRKIKGGWMTDTPKSRTSKRTIPLDSWLAELLSAYVKAHPRRDEPTAPLFPNRQKGGPKGPRPLKWEEPVEPGAFYSNVFCPAVEKAGLPPTRLHDLRHTFATLQLQSGPPDHYMQVSRWLGHADYTITLKVYAHVIPQPGSGKAYQVPPPPSVAAAAPAQPEPGGTVVSLADRRARRGRAVG